MGNTAIFFDWLVQQEIENVIISLSRLEQGDW